MKERYKTLFLLVLIFCFSLFIRLYQLGDMPSGFHKDEVMSAYFGRFILENGRDVYGNFLPLLYVDKFGDYPPSLPMYFSGFSTYLFGFSVFAARFPVAVIGALTIFLFYFLAKEIWQDKRIGLLGAFLLGVLPWHFVLSRATAEGIISLAVVVIGLLFFIKFIKHQTIRVGIIAVICFSLTYFLYPGYRVLIPLLVLPVPFLFPFKKQAKVFLFCALAFLLLLTTSIASTDWGRGRFDQASMFGKQSGSMITSRVSILAQEEGRNHVTEVKIYHNKYILYVREFINQYLTYFSPQYLLMNGGLPYRYAVADEGEIYTTLFPFVLLGLFFLYRMKRMGVYLLYLFLISPMPAPLTVDDVPNVHRTLFMVIPLVLLISFGFVSFLDVIKNVSWKKTFITTFSVFVVIEFIYFLHMYYHHANTVKSFERGDTDRETVQAIIQERNNYAAVYSTTFDVFPIYYLYFTHNVSPDLIGQIHTNLLISQIDNVHFLNEDCPEKQITSDMLKETLLIVDRDGCQYDPRFTSIRLFTRHDGTNSYRFLVQKR